MGLVQAFKGALGGTFADQWKDIITAGYFDEHTVVVPGILKQTNNGRGSNYSGSNGVITNGSKIFVPETAREETWWVTNPTEIQLSPLFVDRKTPPSSTPAKRLVPVIAKHLTYPPFGPFVCTHWHWQLLIKNKELIIRARMIITFFIMLRVYDLFKFTDFYCIMGYYFIDIEKGSGWVRK